MKEPKQEDITFIQNLVKSLEECDADVLFEGFTNKDARIRCASATAAGLKGKRYQTEVLKMLDDDEPMVHQAARAALVNISKVYLKTKTIDFGPLPNATDEEKKGCMKMWSAWLAGRPKEETESVKK